MLRAAVPAGPAGEGAAGAPRPGRGRVSPGAARVPGMSDLTFPPALEDLAGFGGSDEPEFEMFDEFESPEETADWLDMWTGNDGVDGREFRCFGKDFGGGYLALWPVREGRPPEEQPVVYLGSEGDVAVLGRDVGSFLWLLAQGVDPHSCPGKAESGDPVEPRETHPELAEIAERHAPGARRAPKEILARAREEFPHFQAVIDAMCR